MREERSCPNVPGRSPGFRSTVICHWCVRFQLPGFGPAFEANGFVHTRTGNSGATAADFHRFPFSPGSKPQSSLSPDTGDALFSKSKAMLLDRFSQSRLERDLKAVGNTPEQPPDSIRKHCRSATDGNCLNCCHGPAGANHSGLENSDSNERPGGRYRAP